MKNKALFLIALQHELAMAVGNELDLKAMLRIFLKVSLTRLDLRSAHLYLYRNPHGEVVNISEKASGKLSHYLSIPRRQGDKIWSECTELANFSNEINRKCTVVHCRDDLGNHRYGFDVPMQGVLIFESKYPIADDVLQALKPILKKLANSCYASMVHCALLDEISGRKRAEQQVKFQSSHDDLTGLYNRNYFYALLTNAANKAKKSGHVGCIILIGLDQFKLINDTMGPDVSDSILVSIAHRLRTLIRLDLKVARLRGDEYIILLPNLGVSSSLAQPKITKVVEQVNQMIERPVYTRDNSYQLSCSIGYTLLPDDNTNATANELVKQADIAKCKAKRRKPMVGLMYQRYMSQELDDISAYIHEMKRGLAKNEFELYYQPQYSSDHKLVGAEALLRWNNPTRGMESPAKYVKIAEDSDLIVPIGQWVLQQSCRDITSLEKAGLPNYFSKISVNVSPKQLIQHNFHKMVIEEVKKSKITPSLLALEITENVLIDSFDSTIKTVNYLKSNGIECSIDDFGTGYSSLAYLKRIPAFLIKIDRSFVSNVDKSAENAAIVSMILTLGANLKMSVLAEGVTTEEEFACLKRLGCQLYQGYYFGRPMPLDQFKQLLKEQSLPSKPQKIKT